MSTENKPTKEVTHVDGQPTVQAKTFANVLVNVKQSKVSARAKRDMGWAIYAFVEGDGLTPSDVYADPVSVRDRLAALSPAMLGLNAGSFSNLRYLLSRAMRIANIGCHKRRRDEPLNPALAQIYDSITEKSIKAPIGSFLTFCSDNGWLPEDIRDAHVAQFAQMLANTSLNASWRSKLHAVVRAWNRAVTEVPGWSQTVLSDPLPKPEIVCLPWDHLPVRYRAGCETLLAYLADPPMDDINAPANGLRPATLDGWSFNLRHLGSVALRGGIDPETLNGPNDLVRPDVAEIILRHFKPAEDGKGAVREETIAGVLLSIGRHAGTIDPVLQARLKRIKGGGDPRSFTRTRHRDGHAHPGHNGGNNRHKRRGFAAKNKRKIMVIKNENVAARLVTLPQQMFKALDKVINPGLREADLALTAMMIELLLMMPARIGNICSIDLTKNLVRTGSGKTATVRLQFLAEEVKNNQDLEAEMPPETVKLLDRYISVYRPLLIEAPSPYLFPARDGGHRSPQTCWGSLTRVTERYVGIAVNCHLFRHIAATLYLMANPGHYETPRRVLGHASLDTTTTHYCGTETEQAYKLLDENVLRLRREAPVVLARSRRRRPRKAAAANAQAKPTKRLPPAKKDKTNGAR